MVYSTITLNKNRYFFLVYYSINQTLNGYSKAHFIVMVYYKGLFQSYIKYKGLV